MKVRISFRHEGPDGTRMPGDVIDVSRSEGSRLVHEGFATPYGAEKLRKDVPEARSPTTVVGPVSEAVDEPRAPTVAELRALAAERGITTAEAKEVWRLEHSGAPGSTVIPPTTEDTEKEG